MAENLFTVKQAAFILKVHSLTLRRYIREKKLPAVKVGGNVRIRESDLENFQQDFSPSEKRQSILKLKESNPPFSLDDALWRISGRVSALG